MWWLMQQVLQTIHKKQQKKKTASAFVSAKDKAEKKRKVLIFPGTSQTLRWV